MPPPPPPPRARGTGRARCGISASALNPQSLRALMTARHDPPGKILGDHGTGDIKYAARVESTVMSREGIAAPENASVYGARFVKWISLSLSLVSLSTYWIYIAILAIRNLYIILETAEYNFLHVIGNCAIIRFVTIVTRTNDSVRVFLQQNYLFKSIKLNLNNISYVKKWFPVNVILNYNLRYSKINLHLRVCIRKVENYNFACR